MRSRDDKHSSSSVMDSTVNGRQNAETENLTHLSSNSVGKLLRRAKGRGSSRMEKQEDIQPNSRPKRVDEKVVDARLTWNDLDNRGFARTREIEEGSSRNSGQYNNDNEEMDDIEWEDGPTPFCVHASNHPDYNIRELTIELSQSPDSTKRKPIQRATAEDKELAELVHKAHLLCLLARGRIIDSACDDPLIQASLLSLLPTHLTKISRTSKLRVKDLSPLVNWFHNSFHVRSSVNEKSSFPSALAFALETREGTPEEVAALTVALFRALKLTTRFVSILDVASIKPEVERWESSSQASSRDNIGIFNTSTPMVDKIGEVSTSLVKSFSYNEENSVCETSIGLSGKSKPGKSGSNKTQSKGSPTVELKDQKAEPLMCEAEDKISEAFITKESQGPKRKGDLEFEMQLQMALSVTAITSTTSGMGIDVNSNSNLPYVPSPFKKLKGIESEESSLQAISTAVGSRKIGPTLHWAEVFCGGENFAGKWVHVDAVNAIVDGEQKVEAAAAACKTSLRYVVAFAGHGAKDVTRRYCMRWYKIASQRIHSVWWDAVLAPLRELESGATGGANLLENHVDCSNEHENIEALRLSDQPASDDPSNQVNLPGKHNLSEVLEESGWNSFVATRNSLEDMELETRALTEPLPTNQQAYKNHQLYAIERWLTKYQILHPKGPVLGFCSGHPVYPRACVQTLKTKERWLREGLQVKANELPAKVLKPSGKVKKVKYSEEDSYCRVDSEGTIELYGKWQLEHLKLPHAVNGIVPKNERGQVDVWSEKSLPPGTVHLRVPRVFHVAKRLEIDYAPAMVGFEFRNGRSVPVFDGIVVCSEFKDAILEAFAEEEERRQEEEKKRDEAQALSRWYQLLSSIITRQRLNNCYGNSLSSQRPSNLESTNKKLDLHVGSKNDAQLFGCETEDVQDPKLVPPSVTLTEYHEHVFLAEDQSFNEETSARIKRCRCGFSVEVEEL